MGADHMTSSLFDESVARDYEVWYEQGFGRFAVRQEEALLHQQLQHFPRASSLLEVGCGTGHFTRWFATLGFQVTGLDASPAMLEQARLRNGTNYLLGDAQAFPFEHQRFDLVALITTIEFVTDPVQALREAMRVARQGLLLGVLNRQSLLESIRLLRRQRPGGTVEQAHRFSVTTLTQCVRLAAGTRPVRITWRTTIFPGRVPLSCILLGLRLSARALFYASRQPSYAVYADDLCLRHLRCEGRGRRRLASADSARDFHGQFPTTSMTSSASEPSSSSCWNSGLSGLHPLTSCVV